MLFQPSTLAKANKGLGSEFKEDSKSKDAKLRLFTSLVHCRTCRCSEKQSKTGKRLLKAIEIGVLFLIFQKCIYHFWGLGRYLFGCFIFGPMSFWVSDIRDNDILAKSIWAKDTSDRDIWAKVIFGQKTFGPKNSLGLEKKWIEMKKNWKKKFGQNVFCRNITFILNLA